MDPYFFDVWGIPPDAGLGEIKFSEEAKRLLHSKQEQSISSKQAEPGQAPEEIKL